MFSHLLRHCFALLMLHCSWISAEMRASPLVMTQNQYTMGSPLMHKLVLRVPVSFTPLSESLLDRTHNLWWSNATGNSRPEKPDPVVVANIPRSTQARPSFRVAESKCSVCFMCDLTLELFLTTGTCTNFTFSIAAKRRPLQS